MYRKRPGSSGIRGQLYETKLLSLLLYRARHNDDIEEFYLATNVDKIGAFDDICFRAKLRGFDRPIAVFIQAKHRENNKALTLNNENDLTKYFDSYLKIKRAFKLSNKDLLFDGEFEDTECLFVLYTTANGDQNKKKPEIRFASYLNDLIGTNDTDGFHPSYNNENIEFLCKLAVKEQISSLAINIAKIICDNADFRMLLNDELVLCYHVILAQKIMLISDIQPAGHRVATFREDFFTSNEEFITSFRETLFMEVLKRRKVDDEILYLFLYTMDLPTPAMLGKLIGSVIMYNKHGKLEFMNKNISEDLKQQLNKVVVCQSTVDAAIHLAAKEILSSRSFKVPAAFGNKDLTIRGNDEKIEKRLNHLTSQIIDLLEEPQSNSKVTIDETLGKGFLQLNGGIASAVGNILVLDENNKLMKFTDSCESLGKLANRLFKKLKVKIQDLHKYRFEVKVKNFPKLLFQCSKHDKSTVKDFLSKLIFYTNQAAENVVEDILKNEIEDDQCHNGKNFRVRSDAIFLTYHDEIQKWWMSSNKGLYLTKDTETYDKTISKIVEKPLMCIMNVIYRNKISHIDYTFKEDSLSSLKFDVPFLDTIIVTDTIALTVTKVLQSLKNKDHVVLDLEYFLNLPINDFNELCAELMNASKTKILIFVCENVIRARNLSKTFGKIAKAVNEKMKIIITNQVSIEIIKNFFPPTVHLVNDEKNNLTNMSDESIKTILKNSTVIFQDELISLDLIVDDESMALVEGSVLNRIVSKETNRVGKSLVNSDHEEIEHLYVDRRVRRGGKPKYDTTPKVDNEKFITTLNDITDDVVLITAKPGMGKSTLLTHISLKTKELDPSIWIVRINLLEYSREFSKWQENKTNIDILETLNFMCQVVVREKHGKVNKLTIELEESNGIVSLKDWAGEQWSVFEIKLFLHFYNRGRIIFIFDGFDEICPHYSIEVMQLLKTVRSYPRKHKMWVASRSYNKIKSILQREFGISYEILNFTSTETGKYLTKFWKSNLLLKEFDMKQLKNVYDFIEYMREVLKSVGNYDSINKLPNLSLHRIYFNAFDYLRSEVRYTYVPLWKFETEFDNLYGEIFARLRMRYNGDTSEFINMVNFIGTPLHLYLLADYFQSKLKDVSKETNKWNLDINTFKIYERFLDTKLKRIRFQEKNKMDILNPDIMITYEKERADFISKHKRTAAYAIFHRNYHQLFSRKELKEIKNMIKLIKKGGEKTGLIYSIASNNIPIFVHRSFAEHFAVEYLCDLLKIEKCNRMQETMMDFILNVIFFKSPANVRNILDTKLKMDDKLMSILQKNGKVIFDLLMEQTKGYPSFEITDVREEFNEIKYASSLNLALSDNLSNFLSLFISILKNHLEEDNVDNFIKIINETNMFTTAIRVKCEEFITFSLDIVKKIDKSKFKNLFSNRNFSNLINFSLKSNEEILEMFRKIANFTTSTTTLYFTYEPYQDSISFEIKHIPDPQNTSSAGSSRACISGHIPDPRVGYMSPKVRVSVVWGSAVKPKHCDVQT